MFIVYLVITNSVLILLQRVLMNLIFLVYLCSWFVMDILKKKTSVRIYTICFKAYFMKTYLDSSRVSLFHR